jgi:8-amino-7-oxononanoate synthase
VRKHATYGFVEAALSRRRDQNRLRRLRSFAPASGVMVRAGERPLINFCSNDYLGLSRHPVVLERAAAYLRTYGAGFTASRLVCGNYECFDRVEEKLARLKQMEAALLLSSGFQANLSMIPALADRNTVIFSDRFNHNSLIQGCRLAGCAVVVYRHNDMNHLEQLLGEHRNKGFSRVLIVSESVFSMEGDRCDLDALETLAARYEGFLIIDEAHATGVFGDRGMGLTCGRRVDMVMGTFGKGGGSFGAYLACSQRLKEYMVNRCAGLIYSTALPPPVVGAIDAALDLIPSMDKERELLARNAAMLRRELNSMGWHTGESSTQIIPVIVGNEPDALCVSGRLEQNGLLAVAIRPPAVTEGGSRIRISLSALHERSHIDRLIHAFYEWRRT